MKFTFIVSGFNLVNAGALPWKYVYELAANLTQKGCEVQVITEGLGRKIEVQGFTVYSVSKTRQPPTFSQVMNPRIVDGLIEEFSPSFVCVFGDPLSGYFVRRLRKEFPTIVNVSKGVYPLGRLPLSPRLYFINSPIAKFLVRLLNQGKIVAVTVPTLTIKKSLEKCGVKGKKIAVLPMAFDKTLCKHENIRGDKIKSREELGLSERDFVVTYFGPPYVNRGVFDLVRATALLKRKLPVKLLLLIRQDPKSVSQEIRSVRRLASKLGTTDRITLIVSVLPRNRLEGYLESSDVVALPFRYVDEEPPLGLLETMALRKPIITTNIDSLPEVVDKNRGILIRPGNISDLSKAIYYIFKHPNDAHSMATEGFKYVKGLKNWNELADQFLRLAENLSHSR